MAAKAYQFMSRADLIKAAQGGERAIKTAKKSEASIETAVGQFVASAEICGTALLCGFAHATLGEEGELRLFGVPVDMAIGVAGNLTALAFGKYSHHVAAIANGGAASYATRLGLHLGAKSASTKIPAELRDRSRVTNGAARAAA